MYVKKGRKPRKDWSKETTARCGICKQHKEVCHFYWRKSRKAWSDSCKECASSKKKAERLKNPGVQREKNLVAKFDVNLDWYNKLLESQDNKCAVCGLDAKIVICSTGRAMSLDHDHATGQIRGILCPGCNVALGGIDDRLDLLAGLAKYLIKHRKATDAKFVKRNRKSKRSYSRPGSEHLNNY